MAMVMRPGSKLPNTPDELNGVVKAAVLLLTIDQDAAGALARIETDAVVVVAHDRGDLLPANSVGHLIRERCVADQVTQAIHRVGALAVNILENSFERGQVPVDVAEYCYAHIALARFRHSRRMASTVTSSLTASSTSPICASTQR